MKPFIAALAVVLLLPSGALAMVPGPGTVRPHARTSVLAVHRTNDVAVPSRLPARGTDVAAVDQQSPNLPPALVYEGASAAKADAFDWGAAAIGAATGIAAAALMLGARVGLRRRHTRRPSVAV
jgi:hypothetical protein